jgi:hypothetical protein
LQVLSPSNAAPFSEGSGRLQLARCIASAENPLTARVMVNRIWQQHFGRGLVSTSSDFGRRAEGPSHPALLDYLADHFVREGWSMKKLHRLILLSNAYRRGCLPSNHAPAFRRALEIDPENRLLWRSNIRRLRFEEMRDAWLASSGELNREIGGKSADLFLASNVRRSFYGFIDREAVPASLRTFDFASPDLSIPQRTETIVPQQALFLLNHPYPAARVRALARLTSTHHGERERVVAMYRLIFQRSPDIEELEAAHNLLQSTSEGPIQRTGATLEKWEELAHMLLVSNEFLFLD